MQKIFNTILLIIFLVLIALFAYKTLKNPETIEAPVKVETPEHHAQPVMRSEPENKAAPDTAIGHPEDPNAVDGAYTSNESINDERELAKKIHDYIIEHPEVLIESIEGMQKKKLEESEKKAADYLMENKSAIEQEGEPPLLGNKDGDISVVVFYDYNCAYCKQANDFNNAIIVKDPGVKVILRPIPILGGTSMYAAKVSLAVHKIAEDKFFTVHEGMMKMKPLTEDAVKALLAANKIDYTLVENELNSFSVKQLINQNFEFAKHTGIKGAPSYIINGIFIPGVIDEEKFVTIISELRKIAEQTQNQEEKLDYPVEEHPIDEDTKEIIIPNDDE